MIVLFLVLSTSCLHTLLSGTYGPEVTEIGITGREWLWCEYHMCSRSVNALLRCSIKRRTLIASSSLEAPLQRAGRTKDVVQVLIASTYDYIWNTCLGLSSTWMLYLIYLQLPYVLIAMWIVLSMQRPSIHPYAYCTRIPLFTVAVTISPVSLLMLLLQSVATDKLLWARTISRCSWIDNSVVKAYKYSLAPLVLNQ